MNSRRKNRMLVVIAIIVGLGLITTLLMYALRANIDLFYTPSEILQGKGEAHENPSLVSACASVAW